MRPGDRPVAWRPGVEGRQMPSRRCMNDPAVNTEQRESVRLEAAFNVVMGGAVSYSAGTAAMITLFIPGTPLKTTPLQRHA
jgi:hypothetical protein